MEARGRCGGDVSASEPCCLSRRPRKVTCADVRVPEFWLEKRGPRSGESERAMANSQTK